MTVSHEPPLEPPSDPPPANVSEIDNKARGTHDERGSLSGMMLPRLTIEERHQPIENDDEPDSSSDSDYLSFEDSDDEDSATNREARERERQRVLEAAGLIVNQDVPPPPGVVRVKSTTKRRPAPAAPSSSSATQSRRHRHASVTHDKDLPAIPVEEHQPILSPETEAIDHETRLDDAFARYESFKNNQLDMLNPNRLSVISTDSTMTAPASPTGSSFSNSTTMTNPSFAQSQSQISSPPPSSNRESEGSKYSHFLSFLSRGKTPEPGERKSGSISTLNISAPIMSASSSGAQAGSASQDSPSRANSPSFGMSWASLVDKSALEGIPVAERKRQEAIFELINTEIAYVRDVQLVVEVFYSSMLPMLSTKEVTVIFANVEDLLLTNTSFLSSLEERQKDCRLYIDKIGDILKNHIPNMGVYMEYCVNQSTASKVLKSLRDSNPQLESHLQHLRNDNPRVRNLDLASYLLAPMQRVTKYPLLIKQILNYTEPGDEYKSIETARHMAEQLLAHINETIRQQEDYETLKRVSQNLWIGQGRLDLTAPTRYMGPRRLLKEGILLKSKSGKKLHALLCSDILVLTDEAMKNLYRLPIPLNHAQVRHTGTSTDTGFQIVQTYPRGGDTVSLRAPSPRECQVWIQAIAQATRRARYMEERSARRSGPRR